MAQRPHVPKFGNWESGESVPYTLYFEKARKGKTGGKMMINPNDPNENPDMFPRIAAQTPPSRNKSNVPEEQVGRAAIRPTNELRARNGNMGPRGASESSAPQRQGGRGSSSGRPIKLVGKGTESPSLEGKNSYDNNNGRARLKAVTRGDESPDRGAAVPKFGDWDEKNPSSADGYTHMFNRVREERHTEPGQVQGTANKSSSYPRVRNQNVNVNANAKSCCFPWGGKSGS